MLTVDAVLVAPAPPLPFGPPAPPPLEDPATWAPAPPEYFVVPIPLAEAPPAPAVPAPAPPPFAPVSTADPAIDAQLLVELQK
jgi:hypothetical protein